MALNVPSQINSKLAVKFIRKSTKKALLDNGIASTHSGIKELDRLVNDVSSQSFGSLESATEFGEKLGQKIVELSQKLGKKHLDQVVIRQLSQKAVPSAVQTKEEPQVVPDKEESLSDVAPSVVQAEEEPQPTQVQPEDEVQ